jgi:hypothetical protein
MIKLILNKSIWVFKLTHKSCLPVVCHQKIKEFEKRLMITCWFGAGEGNW